MNIDSPQKILVTGGAGFIGSHLCEHFVQKGYQVVCLDNFSTGYLHNIKHLLDSPNFKLIEGDIRNFETCTDAAQQVDFVLHHAALGSVPRSIANPVTTNEVNVSGFLNMLTAAKNQGAKRFVYASSSSVYGDSPTLPKIEEHLGSALSPYAVSKLTGELYAQVFSKTYGLETIGLRYFNVFGPRQDPNGAYAAVIPKFIKLLLNGESPVVNGDGSSSRDFTFVKNVVKVNELAILSKNQAAVNSIFNVACGQQNTINQLINLLHKELLVFNQDIKLQKTIYQEMRTGDIPHSLASIEKANKLLDYNPEINFESGIALTVKWFSEIYVKSISTI